MVAGLAAMIVSLAAPGEAIAAAIFSAGMFSGLPYVFIALIALFLPQRVHLAGGTPFSLWMACLAFHVVGAVVLVALAQAAELSGAHSAVFGVSFLLLASASLLLARPRRPGQAW